MRTILFAGHRLDAGDRPVPRFPAEMEAVAGQAICDAVAGIMRSHRDEHARGMAGGASGGDILFHEACASLHIPTQLYLPMQQDAFVLESVAPAGREWVRRFRALVARVPVVLHGEGMASADTSDGDAQNVWELNNRWLLDQALTDGAHNLTVLVLWDGQMGDGPGGTGDLVHAAAQAGAEIVVLDADALRPPTRGDDHRGGRL